MVDSVSEAVLAWPRLRSTALKILMVVHGFPPDQMAGAEIYAFHIARGLRERGDEVVVFAPGQRDGLEEYEVVEEHVEGLRVLRMQNSFRDLHSFEDTYAHPVSGVRFEEILEAEAPDLVHVQHVVGTSVEVIPRAKARGLPVVVTLHDYWYHCARGQRITLRGHLCEEVQPWRCSLCIGKKRGRYAYDWTRAFLAGEARDAEGLGPGRRLLEFPIRGAIRLAHEVTTAPVRKRLAVMEGALQEADLMLCPSEFLREKYRARGLPEDRLLFWENGMATEHLADFRRESPPEGAPLRFGFVGTLLTTKGIELLVEAFRDLAPREASLDIHGAASGPDPAGFERRLRERAAANPAIRFHGRFPNAELARILGSFDVLIVPSVWWENAPLTLHEAALVSMPVLTSDHGGMAEFVARFGNGLTFRPGDIDDLRAQIRRLAAAPELVAELARPKREVRSLGDDVAGLREHYRRLSGSP
jgi:glycosyltransferase involved in cell wall biosynthesis